MKSVTKKEKTEYLKELHVLEDNMNKNISMIDRMIKNYHFEIEKLLKEKKKIAKSASHNMKLRNKIINEICKLEEN